MTTEDKLKRAIEFLKLLEGYLGYWAEGIDPDPEDVKLWKEVRAFLKEVKKK
jgi:hypothetical protein